MEYVVIEEKIEVIEVYNANQVAKRLGISRASAYRLIDRLNRELEKENYIILSGKISKKDFEERRYI